MNEVRTLLEPFARLDPKLIVELDPAQDAVVRMQGRLSEPVELTQLAGAPLTAARKIVADNRRLFGNIDEKMELADGRTAKDEMGMTHVVLEQKYGDALVMGGQISIHFKADGSLHLLNSSLQRHIDAARTPKLTAAEASKAAVKAAGPAAVAVDQIAPRLIVASAAYLQQTRPAKRFFLCWQVDVREPKAKKPAAWVYFIDATTGAALFRYSSLIAGNGQGYYSNAGPLATEPDGPDFIAVDDQTSAAWATHPQVRTMDWPASALARDDNDTWAEAEPAEKHEKMEVDIHRYLGRVLSYYHLNHSYDGWNGAGGNITAYAHYSDPDNAYWDTTSNVILVGDGTEGGGSGVLKPLSAFDVLAHEFTHGVNDHFNVVQTYAYEIGALNEAIADSFACFASLGYMAPDDPQHWMVGENVMATIRARSLADPSRDSAGVVHYDATNNTTKINSVMQGYYPDHYSIRYTGTQDYGGVHCNAPVVGHAIYLMVNGGTHRLSGIAVAAIGATPVARMLFYVISTPGFLNNTSQFADMRRGMLSACQILYPDNIDYLVTVKTAFKAVGIGPDIYLRDTLGDAGQEPGSLNCMSPDIINRTAKADAALLAQIANINNVSLGQDIEKGQDNFVYFRLFNCGSATGGGTFELYLSPNSTFPTPASWNHIGSFVVPPIAAGGFWSPANQNECLTIPAALTNTLGIIHCCFIGIVSSADDPAPDRMQINSVSEFCDFIRKSNNYAWRNCNIVDVLLDPLLPVLIDRQFDITGFGRRPMPVDLEVDTTNLPRGAAVELLLPKHKAAHLEFTDVRTRAAAPDRIAIGRVPTAIPVSQQRLTPRPAEEFAVPADRLLFTRDMLQRVDIAAMRPLHVEARQTLRVGGIQLKGDERLTVSFVLHLPPGVGARDTHLAFRQMYRGEPLGQMNYLVRQRPRG